MQKNLQKEEQEDQVDLNQIQNHVILFLQNNVLEAVHAQSIQRMLKILVEEEKSKGQLGEFQVDCCLATIGHPCPLIQPNDEKYENYFYQCHICGIRYCGKHLIENFFSLLCHPEEVVLFCLMRKCRNCGRLYKVPKSSNHENCYPQNQMVQNYSKDK